MSDKAHKQQSVWLYGTSLCHMHQKLPQSRLVVLKSGLGLKSGLKSTFAGLGLRLESHGLGLGLGFFFSKSCVKSTSYKVINRQ